MHFFVLILLFLTSCTFDPMYRTNPELYRFYKYWETSDQDWYQAGQYSILVYRINHGKVRSMRLVPHQQGLPSLTGNYIETSQNLAFNLIVQECGAQSYTVLPSQAPIKGRVIDRYFYQNLDLSVGVTYECRSEQANQDVARLENYQWSTALKHQESIDGVAALVETFLVNQDELRQIRVRLFGGDNNLNLKLARKIMFGVCGSSKNTTLLYKKQGLELGHNKNKTDPFVWIYGFKCKE